MFSQKHVVPPWAVFPLRATERLIEEEILLVIYFYDCCKKGMDGSKRKP